MTEARKILGRLIFWGGSSDIERARVAAALGCIEAALDLRKLRPLPAREELESAPVKPAVSVKACWDALRALQRRVTELETTDAMDLEATRAKIKALELVVALKESHHHIKDRIAPGEGAHG